MSLQLSGYSIKELFYLMSIYASEGIGTPLATLLPDPHALKKLVLYTFPTYFSYAFSLVLEILLDHKVIIYRVSARASLIE